MNCRQMTELMQRSLDHDITESEQQTMVLHFRHCPECSAFFERLQLVSDELEALPHVTPPYSIVDKILPQLDELLQDPGYSAALEEPSVQDRNKVRRFGKRSWLAYGGSAAAAILLGVFIYQNAGDFSNGKNETAEGAIGETMQVASKGSEQGGLMGSTPTQAFDSMSPVPAAGAGQAAATATPDPAALNDMAMNPDTTAYNYSGNQNELSSSVRKYKDENHNAGKDTKAGILGSPSPEDAGEKSAAGETGVVKQGVITAPAKGEPDSPADGGTNGASGDGIAGGPYSGSGSDSTVTLSSVTGKYIASIEGQRVTVRDAGDRKVFVSSTAWGKNDKIELSLWYNDYQLSYSVIRDGGIQEKYIIDLLSGTEFQR